MKKILIEGRHLGWQFGVWTSLINSYCGGYDLYRDGVYIGWFSTLKGSRMYAIKEECKED